MQMVGLYIKMEVERYLMVVIILTFHLSLYLDRRKK